jgi:FkbM family methyltransferase
VRGAWSTGYFRVPYGISTLLLGKQSLDIDVETIRGVLAGEYFDSEFADRVVIDGGAHKGYYAMRALERGAEAVYSYEPELSNYQALMITRDMSPRKHRWRIERIALSDAEGHAALHVTASSWAHSLLAPAEGGVIATQEVPTQRLSSILDHVRDGHPGRPLIVKLNIEGAAGTVLLATTPSDWEQVVELWCEFEVNEPYSRAQIDEHLSTANLAPVETIHQTLVRYRHPVQRQ